MAIGDADSRFIDTNVLVYATISAAPFHAAAVRAMAREHAAARPLWISRQVLREYLATLTRPHTFTPPVSPTSLMAQISAFESQFRMAEDGPIVTANLLNLLTTIPIGGAQVHDANIVATMQAYGIPSLLTANVDDFARFHSLINVIPLVP